MRPDPGAICVFWADVDAAADETARLRELLDADERRRADFFRSETDRRRYVVRHGLLRLLLAQCLDTTPEGIRFQHNAFGKPALAGSDLSFNQSHSYGVALFALGEARELGCDIECEDRRISMLETATRFFSSRESLMLERLPPRRRMKAFFDLWTCKEAYVKARGMGLSLPLDEFEMPLNGPIPHSNAHGEWIVKSFAPLPGYHAAVVVQALNDKPERFELREFPRSIARMRPEGTHPAF